MNYSLNDLLAICGQADRPVDTTAVTIGMALPWLAESSPFQLKPLSWHLERLLAGLAHDQVGLQFDQYGQLSGFAAWARVSAPISTRLLRHGSDDLLPAEFLTGDEAWITELMARHGQLVPLLQSLHHQWLSDAERVTYFRWKRGRRIAKRLTRSDRHALLREAPGRPASPKHFLLTTEGEGLRFSAENAIQAAHELGEVVLLARDVPELAALPLPHALARLRIAQNLMQQRLYRLHDGRLCGYLSWAWIDHGLLRGGLPAPHRLPAACWNEGTHLMLCDAFATPAGMQQLLTDLRTGLFPSEAKWMTSTRPDQAVAPALALTADALDGLPSPDAVSGPVINLLPRLQSVQGASA